MAAKKNSAKKAAPKASAKDRAQDKRFREAEERISQLEARADAVDVRFKDYLAIVEPSTDDAEDAGE